MENTITNNAISASLLARNVYGVCFPQRDTMDALHSEFAAAREKFFTGGRKRVRVGRSDSPWPRASAADRPRRTPP